MNLFEHERIISSTERSIVILTNYRIRLNNSISWGNRKTVSIMLEQISSIEVRRNSTPLLLVLAALCIACMLIVYTQRGEEGTMLMLLVFSIVLLVAYAMSHLQVCIISSTGGAAIVFETASMDVETLLRFIDQVEQAKQARMAQLAI